MVKKLGTLINKESEFIHSPFNGEQILGREAITVTVKLSDGKWREVKLQTYSPFGLEFINDGFNFKQGDPITLRVKLAGDETDFDGLIVNSVYEENNLQLAGVRTFIKDKTSATDYSGQDRRTHRRWSCSEDFLPTGTAPNPVRYNDYILFRVEDISSGGLKLITSMRNKFVSIGQRLECTLSLPYVGTVRADVKVKYVNTTFYRDKEFMVLGVEFVKKDSILIRSLGDYLLNFAKETTVKSLNKEGFNIKSVSKWLDFSYVKTEEEYKEVLDLRLRAYKSAGKISKDATKEDMANKLDSKSKILVAKHNGKIVGSIVHVIPKTEEDILICENFPYPESLPKINEIGCSWRFCIDKEFRHADVTHKIIAYVVYDFIKNGRRYWFSAAEKELLDVYRKYGLNPQGITCNDVNLKERINEILIMDTYEIIKGKGVSIKYWNLLYRDLFDYLVKTGSLELTPSDRIRISTYKMVGEIFHYGN